MLITIMMGIAIITLISAFFKFTWGKGLLYLAAMGIFAGGTLATSEVLGSIVGIIISIIFLRWIYK